MSDTTQTDSERALAACLSMVGLTFLVPILFTTAYIWRGWIFSILWRWFITPVFHIGHIGIAQAIGLSLIVGLLSSTQDVEERYKDKSATYRFGIMAGKLYVAPLLVLFIAWIVQMFL